MAGPLRRIFESLPPRPYFALMRFRRAIAPAPGWKRAKDLLHKLGDPQHVMGGPFKGMKYIPHATGSAFLPKIVGSYESELHPAVEQLLRDTSIDRVIDIGSAEGYYAVGFAFRRSDVRVLAYDIDARARYLLDDLAQLNGVRSRVDVKTEATGQTLQEDISAAKKALVICDCEGYELDLLDPVTTSALKVATILVENHDFIRPGITPVLRERFSPTHEITEIATQRTPTIPSGVTVPAESMQELSEGRPAEMVWFLMKPR